MKYIAKLLLSILFLVCFAFPQDSPQKDNRMIITPDGKIMSRIDGSITEINHNLNTLKDNKFENDAPIGTPFSWDTNLNFYASSIDWTVNAIAVSGSDVFIGGNFIDAVGNTSSDFIVRYNQKENTWHSLGSGLNGTVYAIAVSGNNVFVGGDFTDAGGNSDADHIARWDGNNWNALGVGLNDNVYAIAIQGSNVYV
ncbi:MAG: hypothetical protein MUE64_06415, partial [Ignavibacteriaceae bacterium]|nr:hypothetical protein [Ignavibacteriaceae bacterium]